MQTGLPTLFCSDDVVSAIGLSSEFHFNDDLFASTTSRLSHMMLSVASFASILNDRESGDRTKLDPLRYTELLVSLLYRLIDVGPLGQVCYTSGAFHDDLVHFAMLAFMTTLLPKYSSDHFSRFLSGRLNGTIECLHLGSMDTQKSDPSLLLWTLFISGISFFKYYDYRRLVWETCERLNLHDWSSIRCQLCMFPWINSLHDVPGQCLWEDAKLKNDEISQTSPQFKA